MATGLNNNETLELWNLAISNYPFDEKPTDYLLPQHQFLVMDKIITKARAQLSPGGTDIRWPLTVAESAGLTWVDPGEDRTFAQSTGTTQGKAPWANAYGYVQILAAEIRRCKGRAEIKNIRQNYKQRAYVGIAMDMERAFFGLPDAVANKKLLGTSYSIVPITTTQVSNGTADHQGAINITLAAAGQTTVYNVSPTTYPRHQNYNDVWSNSAGEITETDLLKIGKMLRRLHFNGPATAEGLKQPEYQDLLLCADEVIVDAYCAAVRRGRDDIGTNAVAHYGQGLTATGIPVANGLPIYWNEVFDTANATDRGAHPLMALNLSEFQIVFEEGCNFREDPATNTQKNPDIFVSQIDLGAQLIVKNRQRAGGIISYVA